MKSFEEFLSESMTDHIRDAFRKEYGHHNDISFSKQTKPDPKHPTHTVHLVVSHDKMEGTHIVGKVRMNGTKLAHHDPVPISEHDSEKDAIAHVKKHA